MNSRIMDEATPLDLVPFGLELRLHEHDGHGVWRAERDGRGQHHCEADERDVRHQHVDGLWDQHGAQRARVRALEADDPSVRP